MLAWMDLETTGLDSTRDVILEAAALVTDDYLNILAEREFVIRHPAKIIYSMNQVVLDMHSKNGLLGEVVDASASVDDVQMLLLGWFTTHCLPGKVPLCGSTIGFDRSFLKQHMPRLNSLFHYRSVDVSSLGELCKRWYPAEYEARPQVTKEHRAMADIKHSVEQLRYYRSVMFRGRQGPA